MIKYLFSILFLINTGYSLEVSCNFEEVYGNGDVQQGLLLLKGQKLRYEYFDASLFTIIAKDGSFFLINKRQKDHVQKIDKNTDILEILMNIAADFPDINESYELEEAKLKIEKNNNNFVKRVSIDSENLNVSINIVECVFETIDNKYFNHFNFEKYRR